MAKSQPKPKPGGRDDPEQSERFLKAAKEHEAATTEEAATKAFRKVVGKPGRKAD
jgi:hypothetical protein